MGLSINNKENNMSKIQWTDKTANPLKAQWGGNYCEKISPGCANCYASVLNGKGDRFGGNGKSFGGVRPEVRPEMTLNTEMLAKWARMRKPKKHFVGSMTDVFGEWVPDRMIFDLFVSMAAAPLQTFQILTKRPERLTLLNGWLSWEGLSVLPSNIWIGTSAEDQKRLDERIGHLARLPAQVAFLSMEPLLGPIEIASNSIDWVIIGGESGPGARPMKLEWVEDILRQCEAANIPAFVKQLGSHWANEAGASHSKGGDPSEWPEILRVRMFPGDNWE
jgi:protein gp37